MQKQGASGWLINASIGKFALGASSLVFATAGIIPLIRLLIPVGPALIAIALPPLCLLAETTGISPVFFAIVVGISASTSLMNGLDSIAMLAYQYRHWTLVDYFKSGIIPTAALIIMHSVMIMPIITALGY
jgi:sodium-dependent dicarboxylate transporter 2/3/5